MGSGVYKTEDEELCDDGSIEYVSRLGGSPRHGRIDEAQLLKGLQKVGLRWHVTSRA